MSKRIEAEGRPIDLLNAKRENQHLFNRCDHLAAITLQMMADVMDPELVIYWMLLQLEGFRTVANQQRLAQSQQPQPPNPDPQTSPPA